MFLTGPVKKVEAEINDITEAWVALDHWYHVIENQACVTVRLVPLELLRKMQFAQQVMQGNERRH